MKDSDREKKEVKDTPIEKKRRRRERLKREEIRRTMSEDKDWRGK